MIFGNIPKLPMQWAAVVIPFFVSCLMSGIITLINMLRNLGWHEGFMMLWLQNWLVSWAVAFPVVLLILPGVRKLAGVFVDMRQMMPPK
jgi:hypothetical protein